MHAGEIVVEALYKWAELEYAQVRKHKNSKDAHPVGWQEVDNARVNALRLILESNISNAIELFAGARTSYAAHVKFNMDVADAMATANTYVYTSHGAIVHTSPKREAKQWPRP